MKNLRQFSAAILLTCMLTFSAFAGDSHSPGIAGDVSTPGIAGDILTPGLALDILRSALSLF